MPYEPGAPSDRWNVNLPAVIGIVLVFLAGVVAWVVTSTDSDGDEQATAPTPPTASAPAAPAPTTEAAITGTTTPAPMPDLATVTTTATSVTAATIAATVAATAPQVTASPDAEPGAVPGDLGIAGRTMQAPPCNGSYITVLASAIGTDASGPAVAAVLDQFPTANYLRTDQTCPSLTPDIDGEPIYVVFLGPYPVASDACAARADGTPDAYARQLSDDVPPSHSIDCDG